jgi:hypothetical protein
MLRRDQSTAGIQVVQTLSQLRSMRTMCLFECDRNGVISGGLEALTSRRSGVFSRNSSDEICGGDSTIFFTNWSKREPILFQKKLFFSGFESERIGQWRTSGISSARSSQFRLEHFQMFSQSQKTMEKDRKRWTRRSLQNKGIRTRTPMKTTFKLEVK